MKGAAQIIDLIGRYPQKKFRRSTLTDFADVSNNQVDRIIAELLEAGYIVKIQAPRSHDRYQRTPISAAGNKA